MKLSRIVEGVVVWFNSRSQMRAERAMERARLEIADIVEWRRKGDPESIERLCEEFVGAASYGRNQRSINRALAAFEALEALGPAAAEPVGRAVEKYRGRTVAANLARLLGEIGNASSVPFLQKVFDNCGWGGHQEGQYDVRVAAVDALARIGTDRAIPALEVARGDVCTEIAEVAIKALESIRSKGQ